MKQSRSRSSALSALFGLLMILALSGCAAQPCLTSAEGCDQGKELILTD